MRTYKFKIGQMVFISTARSDDGPEGAYIVTQRLPELHGQLRYQVRSSSEDYNRVVRESELRLF
jgi:hypothetical protein